MALDWSKAALLLHTAARQALYEPSKGHLFCLLSHALHHPTLWPTLQMCPCNTLTLLRDLRSCFGGENITMEDVRGNVTAVMGEGGASSAWAKEVIFFEGKS